MAILSNIITPTNVLTSTSTSTVINKTIAFGNNTFTDALPAVNGGTGLTSPGTLGNILVSTGSGWTSSTPSAAIPIGLVRAISINCIFP